MTEADIVYERSNALFSRQGARPAKVFGVRTNIEILCDLCASARATIIISHQGTKYAKALVISTKETLKFLAVLAPLREKKYIKSRQGARPAKEDQFTDRAQGSLTANGISG